MDKLLSRKTVQHAFKCDVFYYSRARNNIKEVRGEMAVQLEGCWLSCPVKPHVINFLSHYSLISYLYFAAASKNKRVND